MGPNPKSESSSCAFDEFVALILEEFPRFRIVRKCDHRLSSVIDRTLKILTFGGQREYLTNYHTVLGDTLYVPLAWERMNEVERVILLRHERVHLRQRRRYGAFLFAFLYLVPFFPLGLAYFRARLEWEAYEETLRATAEFLGIDAALAPELRERIVRRFTGPDYGWMWPFRRVVQSWYDRTLTRLQEQTALLRSPSSVRTPHS